MHPDQFVVLSSDSPHAATAVPVDLIATVPAA